MVSSLELDWIKVITVTMKDDKLDWPLVNKKLAKTLRQGVYQLRYNGVVVKNGCFGEGVTKGINRRINSYRNMSKYLNEVRAGTKQKNGSFNTINILDERLVSGDTVEVYAVSLPDDIIINNLPWKVDLYAIEAYLKELHKDTIWLI